MPYRINIAIPKQLYERLQAVKNLFNVSGVCQEAIEKQIHLQELKGNRNMEAIERLKEQKAEYDKRYYDEGYEKGLKDAPQMDYEELVLVYDDKKFWPGGGSDDLDIGYNYLDDVFDTHKNDSLFNKGSFIHGWIEGVREYFEDNKAELWES